MDLPRVRPSLFPPDAILESTKSSARSPLFDAPVYTPPAYKGSAFEGWARAYIHRQLWRVQVFIDQEDLEQDACVKYWLVCRRYKESVKNGGHLMRLFQSAITNMLTSQARRTAVRIKEISLDTEIQHDHNI